MKALSTAIQIIMPGYFSTLGIPLKRGRDFTVADNIATSAYRFMVNEAFVKQYLRGEELLGKKIGAVMETQNPYGEIIGVVLMRGSCQLIERRNLLSIRFTPI
jgi:putative ABC transport system permease protein